jgi:hypothetical protein
MTAVSVSPCLAALALASARRWSSNRIVVLMHQSMHICHQNVKARDLGPIIWESGGVKTTLELPESLFREAKATAALRGESFKDFVIAALRAHLEGWAGGAPAARGWRSVFGRARSEDVEEVDRILVLERSVRRSGSPPPVAGPLETPYQGMQNVRGEPERCEQEPSVTKARHE